MNFHKKLTWQTSKFYIKRGEFRKRKEHIPYVPLYIQEASNLEEIVPSAITRK
jgi:hypothetical protein